MGYNGYTCSTGILYCEIVAVHNGEIKHDTQLPAYIDHSLHKLHQYETKKHI